MQAPWSHQVELLTIQKLDTKITRLNYQLRHLPQTEEIARIKEKFVLINQKKVQLEAVGGDLRREEKSLEADLEQARSRRTRQQERLDKGQGSPKELLSLQSEIAVIDKRILDLEEKQLPVLEKLEKVAQLEQTLAQKEADGKDKLAHLQAQWETAAAQINTEKTQLQNEREQRAAQVTGELLDLYEQIRERTGGVGAVKVIGTEVFGTSIEFSAAEAARIRSAKPEEVLVSEEHDYILVRYPQE